MNSLKHLCCNKLQAKSNNNNNNNNSNNNNKLKSLFKLSYLNSGVLLILGYLNPALNNPAQEVKNNGK